MKKFFLVAVTVLLVIFFTFPASGFGDIQGADTSVGASESPPTTTAPTDTTTGINTTIAVDDTTTTIVLGDTTTSTDTTIAVDDGSTTTIDATIVDESTTTTDATMVDESTTTTDTTIADTTPPVIVLNGDMVINLKIGSTFTDPGATVTDNVDSSVTVTTTGTVNTNFASSYVISYNAVDAAGNAAATVTRTVNVSSIATVATDKPDYIPDEYVLVTGSGWLPGETVRLDFHETLIDLFQQTTTYYTIADSSGNIRDIQYLIELRHINASFILIATGQTSGLIAQASFTDSLRNGRFRVRDSSYAPIEGATVNINSQNYITDSNGYTQYFLLEDGNNYDYTVTKTGYITVTDDYTIPYGTWSRNVTLTAKVVPTITWSNPADITYGTALSATQLNATASVPGSFVYTPTAGEVLNAGSSQNLLVTFTPTDLTNYTTASKTVTINVSKRAITVTADAKTKTYGDSDPALTYQITSGSLKSGDSLTGALSRNAGENVGSYDITQGTLNNTNYTITYVHNHLAVTARPVTVTADAKTKSYGEADPALTYQITSGSLKSGDSFTGALSRTSGEALGPYAINKNTLALSSNYTLTYIGANLTITKMAITVTADAKTKTYGDSDPALTYQITSGSLKSGDSFTGALSRTSGENVGPYAINQNTLALSSNYALTYIGANLTITGRAITVTADAKTKTYGDSDPALTYQITSGSLKSGDSLTGALSRNAGENVGSYDITQGTLNNTNYTITYVHNHLAVTARPVTVTADAKTKSYGEADPALTYQITSGSLKSGDSFTGALSRTSGEALGPYAINKNTLALSSNYTLTYIGANLTITKMAITVTADAKTKTYGDSDPALTYQITSGSLKSGDSFTGALSRNAGENVGPYAINKNTLALSSNYTLTYIGANLTITKMAITVTADAKTKTYGDSDPALTYQITSGSLKSGDSFTGALSRTSGENVGPYAINQNTLALSSNYALTYIGANLTITGRAITVTADAKTKTYGDSDPALTYQITSGSLKSGDSLTGALSRNAGENVGSYDITQGTLNNTNYTITYVHNHLAVTARPVTVTADAKTKSYGEADPALTYQITSGSLKSGDSFTGALSRTSGEALGPYAINKNTLALSSNYTLTYIGANLTITKMAITVTADAKTKTYGDSDPALTYQITSGSLKSGDSFTGALSRTSGENVGPYAINQNTLALSSNYALTYIGANLTITGRAITVTADAKTKTYGDSDPALTYQITSGSLKSGDSLTGALSRNAGENVGSYDITQGTLNNTNYTITYVHNHLAVTARPVTVTADAKTKSYGEADPALTYQITSGSLKSGDSFTGALSRTSGEALGPYAINKNTLALSSNYTLTYIGANLTITKMAITVTADAKTKTYGDSDPALTYQITSGSLKSGDSLTGALSRNAGENVGPYAINKNTLALSSNYTLTYIGANLTITKMAITVTADAKTKTYGDSDPALTYQITSGSLKSGDSFTGALSRTSGENVGPYAINQNTLALSSNYALTYIGANLTITKMAITVTADAKTKTYGDSDPALTYQITSGSLKSGDSFTGALSRTSGENVGPYAINQNTLALSSNYTLTYIGANLTITGRTITVTADAKTKTYGDSDPALTYTNDPLVGSDSFSGELSRDAGENVGPYAINQGTLALSDNYTINYTGANLVIGKLTIDVTADAKTKTYGDSDPALTYTNDPLVGSDSFSGELSRDAGENVGPYAINQGTLALSDNYTINYIGANLVIGKLTIDVTADAKTKTYGDSDPALTYTNDPLVGSDSFSGELSRDAGENVGPYAINQGTLALSDNYTINYTGANLVIGKLTIDVTADAKTKTYGDSDPALTYTNDPLVGSDSFSGELSRDAGENVGPYAINQGTLTAGTNYDINFVSDNLTITKAALFVTAYDSSRLFGQANPVFTGIITGIQNSDDITATYDSIATTISLPGIYPIVPSIVDPGERLANYDVTITNGELTITAPVIAGGVTTTTTEITVLGLETSEEASPESGRIDVLGIQELPFTGQDIMIVLAGILLMAALSLILVLSLRKKSAK